MRPSLSKYDFGYLHEGGVDWTGVSVGSTYYGPPTSLWWSSIAAFTLKWIFGSVVLLLISLMKG